MKIIKALVNDVIVAGRVLDDAVVRFIEAAHGLIFTIIQYFLFLLAPASDRLLLRHLPFAGWWLHRSHLIWLGLQILLFSRVPDPLFRRQRANLLMVLRAFAALDKWPFWQLLVLST